MNKSKFLLVLVVLLAPMFAIVSNAADIREHIDRLELGVSAGAGFYVGEENPLGTDALLRVQAYDALGFGEKPNWGWPGIETFGFMVGYRLDARWHLKLQTTRQRLCFVEFENGVLRDPAYNAMWHVDAMAEFNMLNLGNVMLPKQGLYSVVPYLGFGLGVTMYNKMATVRGNEKGNVGGSTQFDPLMGTMYPRVGFLPKEVSQTILPSGKKRTKVEEWETTEVGVGLYFPVAFGVKWRVNDNLQLKGTFQYQLYLYGGNLDGASDLVDYETYTKNTKWGSNHDCTFSLTAIFNLGKWYEDRLITY
jgi:hypothetical protein